MCVGKCSSFLEKSIVNENEECDGRFLLRYFKVLSVIVMFHHLGDVEAWGHPVKGGKALAVHLTSTTMLFELQEMCKKHFYRKGAGMVFTKILTII